MNTFEARLCWCVVVFHVMVPRTCCKLAATNHRNKMVDRFVSLYTGAIGGRFVFIDNNTCARRVCVVIHYLQRGGNERMDWPL